MRNCFSQTICTNVIDEVGISKNYNNHKCPQKNLKHKSLLGLARKISNIVIRNKLCNIQTFDVWHKGETFLKNKRICLRVDALLKGWGYKKHKEKKRINV